MGKIFKHQVEKPIIFEFLKVRQGMSELVSVMGLNAFGEQDLCVELN